MIKMRRLDHNKYWDGGALLGGILFVLSFAPINYHGLVIPGMLLLLLSWQHASPGRAAFRGFLFGLASFGVGVSWVFVSLYDFGGATISAALMLTLIFVGFWSLFPALAGYLAVKCFGNRNALSVLTGYSLIWILVEYVRGEWVFNGFPWLQIAYSQMDTIFAGYVPLMSVYGCGILIVFCAILLQRLFYGELTAQEKLYVLLLISCIVLAGAKLKSIEWTKPLGGSLSIAMIQGNIAQENKWRPDNRNNILQQYKTMTAQNWAADVIIWPETAIPAFYDQVKESFLIPLERQAKNNKSDLIISLPVRNKQKNEYYNAVMTFGKYRGEYHKIHLLPFGEYLPLQPLTDFLQKSLKIMPIGSFTSGVNDQALLQAGGYPFSISICYEDVFGDAGLRRLSEAAYLVNVTNDGWFGASMEPYQHMQIARMRALETGRYLLRATNTGVTAIVSPQGKIVKNIAMFKTAVLTARITPMGGMTPYARMGNRPIILLLVVGIIFCSIDAKQSYVKKSFSGMLN